MLAGGDTIDHFTAVVAEFSDADLWCAHGLNGITRDTDATRFAPASRTAQQPPAALARVALRAQRLPPTRRAVPPRERDPVAPERFRVGSFDRAGRDPTQTVRERPWRQGGPAPSSSGAPSLDERREVDEAPSAVLFKARFDPYVGDL